MTGHPRVSVVIPSFNGGHLLDRTLRAALAQEDVDLEVIVVDDGSTDDTPERLAAVDDTRVHLILRERSGGPSRARNEGIAASRGQWIAFLDQDDVWAPHKLRTQLEIADREDATFVYCAAVRVDAHLEVLRFDDRIVEPRDLRHSLMRANGIAGGASGPIADAAIVRHVGGFDPDLRYMEDWDLWIRLASEGVPAVCREPLLAYVVHPRSMLLTEAPDLDRELARMTDKHADLIHAAGARPNGMETYRWLAWSEWIAGRRLTALRAYATGVRRHGTGENLHFAGAQLTRAARARVQPRQSTARLDWLEQMQRTT